MKVSPDFCQACGTKLPEEASFCPSCGRKVEMVEAAPTKPRVVGAHPAYRLPDASNCVMNDGASPAVAPSPTPHVPPARSEGGEERILLVVSGLMRAKKLSSTQYTLVGTDRRLIFAQITNQMIKEETRQAKDQARGQGKGILGQMAAQWGSTLAFQDTLARISNQFWSMHPETILQGSKENFSLPLASLTCVEVERKDQPRRVTYDDDYSHVEHNYYTELRFLGQNKVIMRGPDNPTIGRNLSQIYGALVR